MRRLFIIAAFTLAFVGCQSLIEEFQPVLYTGNHPVPEKIEPAALPAPTHTIAQIAQAYKTNGKHTVNQKMSIVGVISTTDQPGNFYKSFYIQDETGGIEIKIGKNGLYNDYLEGQQIMVDLKGLTIGEYGTKSGNYGGKGMVQVGFNDPSGEYETSYLEVPLLIDQHIIKGSIGEKVTPVVLSETQLPGKEDTQLTNSNIGKLVTINDLTYGGATDDSFVLLYIDSNKQKKSSSNRIFISGKNTGITTWAMSKEKMTKYLASGIWDNVKIGNANDYNYGSVADRKDPSTGEYNIEKNAYSVSQYFHTPEGKEIQLRTSGFSKFADKEIDPEVLSGAKKVSITGILNLYQGNIQMVVNNIDDIKY